MDNNTGKPTVNNGKRRFPMKNEYAKIGLMLFIVVAGSILFYFSFFKDHTLFGFFKSIWSCLMPFTVDSQMVFQYEKQKWSKETFAEFKYIFCSYYFSRIYVCYICHSYSTGYRQR